MRSRRSISSPMCRTNDASSAVLRGRSRAQNAASLRASARRLLTGARVITCGMPRHLSARRRPSAQPGRAESSVSPAGSPRSVAVICIGSFLTAVWGCFGHCVRCKTRHAGAWFTNPESTEQQRRIGDLNPGGWLHPTALAARGRVVRIGSGWTSVLGGSCVDGAARRWTATQIGTMRAVGVPMPDIFPGLRNRATLGDCLAWHMLAAQPCLCRTGARLVALLAGGGDGLGWLGWLREGRVAGIRVAYL